MDDSGSISNDESLYTESIKASNSVGLFVSAIYLTLISISTAMAMLDSQFILMSSVIIIGITVAFPLLYMNFRVMKIVITERMIDVRYGVFNRKMISMGSIIDCEHIQIGLREYGGVGIRLGRDGTWAYNTTLGDAVRVTPNNERPFAFSTAEPDRVCELIRGLTR